MMISEEFEYKYPSDHSLAKECRAGRLTKDSEEYITLLNYIKWSNSNPEVMHLIGLIQLLSGTLNIAKKQNQRISIFLDYPETNLHPKRERKLMTLIEKKDGSTNIIIAPC